MSKSFCLSELNFKPVFAIIRQKELILDEQHHQY